MSRFLSIILVLILGVSFSIQAQTAEKKSPVARPNIPGSFMIDFGLNGAFHAPTDFEYGIWGSRTVNLYYQYPIRFGRSKFSFNPGAGVGLERFKLESNFILRDTAEAPTADPVENYSLVKADPDYFTGVKKVMLVANYFDVPLEFRFDSKPEDISRSFNVAIGGRIGYLFDSQQKVKYKEDGQWKKSKDKQNWGLNQLRYGVYMRVGIGAFNLFGFYNLSPLFAPGMGPDQTKMNTFTAGISLNGF